MRAKKSLGQNFLTSIPARIAIINAGNLTPTDAVLEIGPGKGFLTKGLVESGARVVALEKDPDLLPLLRSEFSSNKKFSLLLGDALSFSPKNNTVLKKGYKVVANIPYYITGAILEHYLSNELQPSHMVVLVQKEVAERVVARDGKESILSLSVKVYGDPKIVYRVNRGSFNPPPSVDSAVLSIEHISKKRFKNKNHEKNFFNVLKAGFSHKRKFLLSNLKEKLPQVDWSRVFNERKINVKIRAEDVCLEDWLLLSQ